MSRTEKIEASHFMRKAILYIRQSTMRQVYENTESTIRQYALKERLVNLGWAGDMIEIIDCDLGRSGTEITDRNGFRQMLADVGEGNVGAIACIECSRLSRSSGDWGRLMEICALSGTILIDDDGIYDPNDFNDRLLLGLKGTMSEAELHFLHERMRGGALSKAVRGELRNGLPVGYIYDESGKIIKDPNIQIQQAITLFFDSFRICGTAHGLATYYSEKGYRFPTNKNRGFGGSSDIYWDILTPSRAQKVLRCTTYAGTYVYGKIRTQNTVKGRKRRPVADDQTISFIENHHEAYITIEEYRENCERLTMNSTRSETSVPREGNALLQGIVICSKCGNRMSVNYKTYNHTVYGVYACAHIKKGEPYYHKHSLCINGRVVDQAVSEIVLEKLTPEAVKAAEEIHQEIERRKAGEDNYFALQVDKAKYEVDLARKRYMNADPANRLVAAELERLWNERMHQLAKAETDLRKYRSVSHAEAPETKAQNLIDLPEKLEKAWKNNSLGMTDKKRIIRCLVEDVSLNLLGNEIVVGIRFKGGLTECINVRRPPRKYETWTTDPEIVAYVKEGSKKYTVEEMVDFLNSQGKKSGKGLDFTLASVRGIQYSYGIPSLKNYLRSIGYLSTEEKAKEMGISQNALNKRRSLGKYGGICIKTTGGGSFMYAP